MQTLPSTRNGAPRLPILWSGVPHSRTINQQQFGPAPASFLLFSGQPVPQRRHQIIVRQLVVFRTGLDL